MPNRLALVLAALLTADVAGAVGISLYQDPTWVEAGSPGASAESLAALLAFQGHTVSGFSGLTGAGFSVALSGADLVLFPSMLNYGALASALEPGAAIALSDFVDAGGGLVVVGESAGRLLNRVFFPDCDFVSVFCFASSGAASGGSFLDLAEAAGTPYATAPATLTSPPDPTDGVNPFAFFPAGGINLYRDRIAGSPNSTTALTAPYGAGGYGLLAWGFAGSVPGGGLDGGWADLLGVMVEDLAGSPVPEPAPWLLLGVALPLLGRRGRGPAAGCR